MKNIFQEIRKKITENIKRISLYGAIFGISVISTFFINTELFKASIISTNTATINNICDGGTFEKRFYEGDTSAFFDTFNGSSDYDWGFPDPTISSYNSNGVLSSIPEFNLNSNLKPKGAGDIIVLQSANTVTINKPVTNITRDDIAAQFNYTVKRFRAPQDQYITQDPNPTYQYKLVSAPDFTVNFQYGIDLHPDFANSTAYSDTECFNVYVSWCGDGTIDDGTNGTLNAGETCDDGNNIDGDGCSATCGLEPVNGICGTSNGTTQSEKPIINLCLDGSTPTVNGDGPWTWICAGSSGGTDASCSANLTPVNTPVNGVCGDSHLKTLDTKPTTDLCAQGIASGVNGDGPWTWSCIGIDGGTDTNCLANKTNIPPVPQICGDSIIQAPNDNGVNETCDDGNLVDGDGCSSTCQIETPVPQICGDGIVQTPNDDGINETCDDGNLVDGDGCNATCQVEIPTDGVCGISDGKTFSSTPTANLCSVGTEINLINVENPDGWTWECQGILGGNNSNCSATKSSITEDLDPNPSSGGGGGGFRWRRVLCGNGIIDHEEEECDDGNNMSGDGCSSHCHIEKVCGDGIVDAININGQREQCDDGNLIDGDGCSSTCEIDKIIVPEIVNQQFCGNGKIEEGEECDDGNLDNYDSCNNACMINQISIKTGQGSSLSASGQGILFTSLFTILLSVGIFFRKKFRKILEKFKKNFR